ncbi:hypothetical protein IWW38_000821 [Coemansia aciculifera]|uniref:Uncharacterized protein n=1 Tax=Coemansia aciculifera TaxID=417176 RepID=A0ACC1M846_9FUNG|nr:hypothetical protein IWW38_000821 [Coemansia aciculifera]
MQAPSATSETETNPVVSTSNRSDEASEPSGERGFEGNLRTCKSSATILSRQRRRYLSSRGSMVLMIRSTKALPLRSAISRTVCKVAPTGFAWPSRREVMQRISSRSSVCGEKQRMAVKKRKMHSAELELLPKPASPST